MPSVDFDDLQGAVQFVSGGAFIFAEAYVSLETGEVFITSDDLGEEELGELPPDLGDPERYADVPDQHSLNLGRRVALDFTAQELPARFDEVDAIFQRKGAFRRFKDLLEREGLLDRWHAYEEAAEAAALQDWCQELGLELRGGPVEGPPPAEPASGNQIQRRILLRSDPATVWHFLDTDAGRAAFWAESAVEQDGAIHFVFPGGDRLTAPILERVPHQRLVFRYFGDSRVDITLKARPDGGTELTVHEPACPPQAREDQLPGWTAWLLILKAQAEHGIDLRNGDAAAGWGQGFVDGQ